MLLAKIYESNEKENIIFLEKDKDYYLSGFSIDENGFSFISNNLFDNISELFIKNKNYILLGKVRGYEVYLDKENNVKHFYKNGKENLELFIEINSKPAVVYNTLSNIKSDIEDCCIEFKNYVISFSKTKIKKFIQFFSGIDTGHMIVFLKNLKLHKKDISFLEKFEIKSYEDFKEIFRLNKHFDDDLIEYLIDSKFLEDVFDYLPPARKYMMAYNLYTLRYIDDDLEKYNKKNNTNTLAIYNSLTNDITGPRASLQKFIGHEFAHVMQPWGKQLLGNNKVYLPYIMEAVADLIQAEYYNQKKYGYPKNVINVCALMEILGPRIIWEYAFSGDITELDNILKEKLSQKEAEELMGLLKILPKNDDDLKHIRVSQLILNLYDKTDEIRIPSDFSTITYLYGKSYFNEDKMKDNININAVDAYKLGLVRPAYDGYVVKVEEDIYNDIKKNYEKNKDYSDEGETYIVSDMVDEISVYDFYSDVKLKEGIIKKFTITTKEAIERGYIKEAYLLIVSKEILDKYNLTYEEEHPYGPNKTINDNITFDEKTFTYNYKIEPINKIFPNDCIRKNKSKIK